jgi:hypothetical protein
MKFFSILCILRDTNIKVYSGLQVMLNVKGEVSVLNQAPRHEDVLGSEGVAPRILNLGAVWK